MSRQLKILLAGLSLVFLAQSSLAQSNGLLQQMISTIQGTLKRIDDPSLSDSQKLEIVRAQKAASEATLREIIMSGAASSDDLNNPESDVARAFRSLDRLTVLDELQINPNTQRVTATSCGRTRSLLAVSSINPVSGEVVYSTGDQALIALINQFCGSN